MARYRGITILHGNDGSDWCDYLLKKFNYAGSEVNAHSVNVDELVIAKPPEIEVSVTESYALTLIITADFVRYMEENKEWLPAMLENRNTSITTIVAVTINMGYDEYLNETDISDYQHDLWQLAEIEGDGSNVQDLVFDILNMVDDNSRRHAESLERGAGVCQMFPTNVKMTRDSIAVVFNEQIKGDVTLAFDGMHQIVNTVTINPFCVYFTPPALSPGRHTVHILLNGEEVQDLPIVYCNIEFTSLELLKQFFGVASVDELDNVLSFEFRNSYCTEEAFEKLIDMVSLQRHTSPPFPTIIHWAAANGLRELTSELLTLPSAAELCKTPNCHGMTVSDLALKGGHRDLQKYIHDFLETNRCVNICEMYVQYQSPSSDDTPDCGEQYVSEDSYFEALAAKQQENEGETYINYAEVSGMPTIKEGLPPPIPKRQKDTKENKERYTKPLPATPRASQTQKEPKLHPGAVGCRSQSELIEIMNEVKKGNFTCYEAEMLFNAWRERNADCGKASSSFRDKQKSLEMLRGRFTKPLNMLASGSAAMLLPEVGFDTINESSHISSPISYRNDPNRKKGQRHEQRTSDFSPRSSSSSVGMRVSQDSGCHVSADIAVYSDFNDSYSDERKSLAQQFRKSNVFDTSEQRPPVPPRQDKKPTTTYTRKTRNRIN